MEAKHQYFKNAMRHIRNFKNPAFSLANQHQLFQCFLFSRHQHFAAEEMGVTIEVSRSSCPFGDILPPGCSVVHSVSWL